MRVHRKIIARDEGLDVMVRKSHVDEDAGVCRGSLLTSSKRNIAFPWQSKLRVVVGGEDSIAKLPENEVSSEALAIVR